MATASPEPIQWLPALLMTAGLVVLGVLLTASIRNKIARRYNQTPEPRDMIDRIKRGAPQRDEFAEAESRYLDTTRRLAALLDNKTQRLEQLIADADERLAALTEATTISPTASARVVTANPDPPSDTDPLTRTVYSLADEGRKAVTIARQLDEPIGKVELILALRETRRA